MRTSFHHQPEARHPNFLLSTSWQADYPIFSGAKQTTLESKPERAIDEERHYPMPLLGRLRPSAFLRCSDTQPEEKFVHSGQRHHRRGFVVVVLCLRVR